jgi:hypothetical protein
MFLDFRFQVHTGGYWPILPLLESLGWGIDIYPSQGFARVVWMARDLTRLPSW